MKTVEGAGVELAYEESGSGPAVLLVHGLAADRRSWAPVAAALDGVARVIAYDRRGYGDSGAPQPYERTTVAEQAEDAAALLAALDTRSVVACGVDMGALVVLDLLLRHPGAVRAAVLVDPSAFQLVPEANEALSAERLLLGDTVREEGTAQAVAAWLAARGAVGADVERAGEHAGAFFADFGGQATLELSRRRLRELTAEIAILDGPGAPSHVRAAGDALAELLPSARRGGVEDPAAVVRALLGTA